MKALFEYHFRNMVDQLLDSTLESTRVYWRKRCGYSPEIVNDPRPLGEINPEWKETTHGRLSY